VQGQSAFHQRFRLVRLMQGQWPEMASPRIVIATSDLRESGAFTDWLHTEGFAPVRKILPEAAASDLQARACDLLITDMKLAAKDGLVETLRKSPRNRRTPAVLIGAGPDAQARADAWGIYYLERPVERASLVATASMAIMEGRPIRRSPRKTIGRFEAVINDSPAYIVDVSREGLRLEIPRDRNSSPPPPVFAVRIPMVGVALKAQRVWASTQTGDLFACGATLACNDRKAEQGWRAFIDAVPTMG